MRGLFTFFSEIGRDLRGHPPRGLSEARRVRKASVFLATDPPRGRPFGGGGVYPIMELRDTNPFYIDQSVNFANPRYRYFFVN